MKEQALKNLSNISLEDIIEKIKSLNHAEYDKMIIDKNQSVKRTNFFRLNYSGKSIDRQSRFIRFPMYGAVKDNFQTFAGGEAKHGAIKLVESPRMLETLNSNYSLTDENDAAGSSAEHDFLLEATNL